MWSTNTLEKLCSAEGQGRHYGLDEAGVWADCIRERRPVVHNDYSALPHRKGMPAGHAPVVRELVVPILRNERIVAVLGVGNKPQEYDQRDVEMVQSLANLAWDIVMRKKAEEQMDLQAMVLDQTSDRVCISDLDGVIRYVNEAESLALKRSRSELIGRHISVFGEDAELGATQQEVIDSTLANGQWRGEVVNFASNGAQSMVDLRTFLVRSPSGKAIALCGIGTDITTQRRSEAALRESELFLRETQRIGRMGGWKANPKTDYLKWTDGVYEIIGAPRAYAPGMSEGLEFFLPEYIPLLKRNAEKCLETGEPFTLECQVQTTGGDKLWAEVRGLKSLQESSGSYVIGTFQDIDQRKKYEADLSRSREQMREMYRQLQNTREEERKRISREIHDELGQNITATKIDLAWLRKRIDPSQTALLQKLTSMEAVADATLETVRRVSSELRPGILDALGLAAAVDWLVKDFQVRSEIECRLVIEPEEIEVAPNLATDVFRILQEALTNILRYARASTVEVILKKKEAQIEMQVMDNGIGISEEKVSQADSLGFLGIRERLRPYGGVLRISGAPGKGTAMIVAIPIS
jgi:PAS domain S-box-containing protein